MKRDGVTTAMGAMRPLVLALALGAGLPAQAAIQFPALEIMTLADDTGATGSGAAVGSSLTLDATATLVLASTGVTLVDLPDTPFALTAVRIDASHFGPGTLTVGSLLSASFASLTINGFGSVATFGADLTFTGGTLAPAAGAGRIEGTLSASPATIDVGGAFTAPTLIAKLGPVEAPVVPLPPAVWLFGSVCAALFARRRRTVAVA
jgi:hypothetical protein